MLDFSGQMRIRSFVLAIPARRGEAELVHALRAATQRLRCSAWPQVVPRRLSRLVLAGVRRLTEL